MSDNRGAASVIGVILLVAVTVVLAGVAGVYAMGFSDEPTPVPPQGSFAFDYQPDSDTASFMPNDSSVGSDTLTVSYRGGEPIPSDRVNVTVYGAKEVAPDGTIEGTNLTFEPDAYGGGNLFSTTNTVTAGDSYTISDLDFISSDGNGVLGERRNLDLSEATVRVYWVSKDGDNGAVIARWTGDAGAM